MTATLGVILVNWRGAGDTVECLESLRRAGQPLRVVVVDNASGDGSLDRIEAWARGEQPAVPADSAMVRFSVPPAPKPIPYRRLAAGKSGGDEWLTLIDSGSNLGFAGGNNVGLRHFAADPAIAWFWLLNNDTVVDAEAPAALVAQMAATPDIGMCGTVVRYYHRPDTVQALCGSRFNLLTGTSRSIGSGQPATAKFDAAQVARDTDFVLGASLAVSRAFLETVGPMEEGYFLYFEEIDWAWRAAGRFVIGFAPDAVVYHKEGGSIGSSGRKGGRSVMSEYHLMRAKLLFVRRFRPALLPLHWAVAAAQIGARLVRRQPDKALVMTRALFGLKG